MKKFKDNNKGFSLVELIVVIAIMVVLIAVLGSTILGYVDKSKYSKDITALDSLNTAVKTFVADPSTTTYPNIETDLATLISTCDKGNVILPIISEVFKVNGATNTTAADTLKGIEFNNSSKAFAGVKLEDVKVIIDASGAVSIQVKVKDNSGYANYKVGNGTFN